MGKGLKRWLGGSRGAEGCGRQAGVLDYHCRSDALFFWVDGLVGAVSGCMQRAYDARCQAVGVQERTPCICIILVRLVLSLLAQQQDAW